jgi:hypothetical protein
MKIHVEYKRDNGGIEARITILDMEGFDSNHAFCCFAKYPSDYQWGVAFFAGKRSLVNHFPTSEQAEYWVKKQITALKEKLNHWRGTRIPQNYVISI